MWYSHQIQPADSNFRERERKRERERDRERERERERERVIGHFSLGTGNVIIAGHLTLSNPCISSYGYVWSSKLDSSYTNWGEVHTVVFLSCF